MGAGASAKFTDDSEADFFASHFPAEHYSDAYRLALVDRVPPFFREFPALPRSAKTKRVYADQCFEVLALSSDVRSKLTALMEREEIYDDDNLDGVGQFAFQNIRLEEWEAAFDRFFGDAWRDDNELRDPLFAFVDTVHAHGEWLTRPDVPEIDSSRHGSVSGAE